MAFAKGIMIPDILKQKTSDELERQMKERAEKGHCYNCGAAERKYVDARTKRVACSFECYKVN